MSPGHRQIHLHFVWATYHRLPLLEGKVRDAVYATIISEVNAAGCDLLALGGMPDHVHLAATVPPMVAPSRLIQRVKGASSTMGRETARVGGAFGWQDGYGVFSFSRSHLPRVVGYIRHQRRHHESGRLWMPWEATSVEE